MIVPAYPIQEAARLETLRGLNVLDTPAEERFDRLTRLAKRMLDVPIALVSLVDANRQWFKSCVGLSATETPRDVSFCGHAILGDGLFVIPDAATDERFHDNPLVTNAPYIRFYAGCPLEVGNGNRLGTLCVIDTRPRQLSAEDCDSLLDLARMAELELAAVQLATQDELTQLANRRGFESISRQVLRLCRRLGRKPEVLYFDLNGFKRINDTFGHAEGDRALQAFARLLQGASRESDVVARLGGDEFAALLSGSEQNASAAVLARLEAAVGQWNAACQVGYQLRYSVGISQADAAITDSVDDCLACADREMYQHKHALKVAAAGAGR